MVKVSSDEDQNQSRGFGKGELGTRTAGRGRLQDPVALRAEGEAAEMGKPEPVSPLCEAQAPDDLSLIAHDAIRRR